MWTLKIEKQWYRSSLTWLTFLLLPLTFIFYCVVKIRRLVYAYGLKKIYKLPVPVIVVGNITVGGTGKTPFVISLATYLKEQGYTPGIATRGVGGKQQQAPRYVDDYALATDVGDEAILLKKRTQCPVVVGIDRVAAVYELISKSNCNIIISDDGLQHYRLGRDIEIAIVDSTRQFGNGYMLPAGPLREPISRLDKVDFVISKMSLLGDMLISLDQTQKISLATFKNKKIHAVAAIGNPQRFFKSLRDAGLDIIEHIFPDHYLYQENDLLFSDDAPILMTEKDAVKCLSFDIKNAWYLPVTTRLDNEFLNQLRSRLV
ncbi:MAG: tetraacyldisaccharide 4'-kinase [Gammaproteobacteria bacterium]|nr:tetraacyldisaccharide 4'-kinase [Gammaproteobacteria bacterium]